MKVVFQQDGQILAEQELDPEREYLIGRAPECDIRLGENFISRQHARVYFQDGEWWVQDLREGHKNYQKDPIKIHHDQKITLEGNLELMTDTYLAVQKTGTFERGLYSEQKRHFLKSKPAIALLAVFLLISGSLAVYVGMQLYSERRVMTASELFDFVRPKVVEFKEVPNREVIEQLKKYAKLKDDDFRGQEGYCSGFVIAKNVVLTAKHCVFGFYGQSTVVDFVIQTHDQKTYAPARIFGFDGQQDYLFLEVPGLAQVEPLALENRFKIGERVFTVGNVHGEGIAIREGIIASKTKDELNPEIESLRFSAAASPGNSGGPLVNSRGEVLGLVFARSNLSENYNKAALASDLASGMKEFVHHPESKKITIRFKEVPFLEPAYLFSDFGFFFPSEWARNPEVIKIFHEIQFEVEVPLPFKMMMEKYEEAFRPALQKAYDQVQAVIVAKQKEEDEPLTPVGLQWAAQATEKDPLLIPFPTYDTIYLKEVQADYLAEEEVRIYLPADSWAYQYFQEDLKEKKKYRYSPQTMTARLQNREQQQLVYHDGSIPEGRARDWYYLPHIYAALDFQRAESWDAKRTPSAAIRSEIILGKKGIAFSQLDFMQRWVKANRAISFTLKELPSPSLSEVEDQLGRKWSQGSWNLFGEIVLNQYCLPLPVGFVCLMQQGQKSATSSSRVDQPSFVRNTLSEALVHPTFWPLDALLDYYQQGYANNLQGLDDVLIQKLATGEVEIQLKTAGVTFHLKKKEIPAALRIVPAFYRSGEQASWIAVGFTGFYPKGVQKAEKIFCGADIQLAGIMPYVFSLQNQEEVGNKKQLVTKKNFESKGLGKPATILTFCQPLHQENQENESYYFGEYRPHTFNVRLD